MSIVSLWQPQPEQVRRGVSPVGGPAWIKSAALLVTGAAVAGWLAGCERHPAPAQGSAPTIIVQRSERVSSGGGLPSFAPTIERVAPSVVSVYSSRHWNQKTDGPLMRGPLLKRFFGSDSEDNLPERYSQEESLGSGVIVSSDGYILTNNHVVDGASEVRVAMANGQEFTARLVGVDPGTDIALLKVDRADLPAAVLADSRDVRVGDLAFAIGNPFGVGQTVTMGIVSATERTGFGITEYEDFIQTDAAVNPGNSGGPLIDAEGRVMGINTAILSRSGGYQGIGFAVPINLARFTMEQLIKHGQVLRGYLGIFLERGRGHDRARSEPRSTGAEVAAVAPRSPAARGGLQAGDVVVEVNGNKIGGGPELRLAIAQLEPGATARLRIVRKGANVEAEVTVGQAPPRETSKTP